MSTYFSYQNIEKHVKLVNGIKMRGFVISLFCIEFILNGRHALIDKCRLFSLEEAFSGLETVEGDPRLFLPEGRGDRQCSVWTRRGAEGPEAGPNRTLPVSEARGARMPRPM